MSDWKSNPEEGIQLLLHHHEDVGKHFPGSGEKVYIVCSISLLVTVPMQCPARQGKTSHMHINKQNYAKCSRVIFIVKS